MSLWMAPALLAAVLAVSRWMKLKQESLRSGRVRPRPEHGEASREVIGNPSHHSQALWTASRHRPPRRLAWMRGLRAGGEATSNPSATGGTMRPSLLAMRWLRAELRVLLWITLPLRYLLYWLICAVLWLACVALTAADSL